MPFNGLTRLLKGDTDLGAAARGERETPCLQRRGFLRLAAAGAGTLAAGPALAKIATPKAQERAIALYNPHTDESVKLVYWVPDEGYLNLSIKEISWVLRDRRTEEVEAVDPKLLDQLYGLQLTLGSKKPLHILSGYRSPETNEMLRRRSSRVAKHSYHMTGQAIDICLPGYSTSRLRKAAVSLKAGGVGYYPRSGFIHLDTGPIRYWS